MPKIILLTMDLKDETIPSLMPEKIAPPVEKTALTFSHAPLNVRSKKEATFISDEQADPALMEKTIKDIGYDFLGCVSEPYKKRGIFG